MASRRRSSLCSPCVLVSLVFVILAISLGVGLGVGLHHHRGSSVTTADSASSTPTAQLRPSPPSKFALDGLAGQDPQTRVFNFTISEVTGTPDGFPRSMLVVNGQYPGPTIEVNQADRVIINVQNNLSNATAIHWHGLFQNGTNFYDGTTGVTECGIPSGQLLTYNFTLGAFSGTTWWHAHSTQYTDGITGSLVVHPTDLSPPGFPVWDEELVIVMADWYHDRSPDLLAQYLSPEGIQGTQGNEPVPDAGTLNGLGQYFAGGSGGTYFNFTLQPDKTYRLRLTNTGSFASVRFSIDDHPLTLIEADGTLVTPYTVSGVVLAVAQRYSVLVHTNATGNGTYWMRSTIQSDMFTYDQPGQNTDVRGILRYSNAAVSDAVPGAIDSTDPGPGINLPDMDTSLLVPAVRDPAPDVTRVYPVSFAFELTADGQFLGFMNNTSWLPLSKTTTLLSVRNAPATYAPDGSSVQENDQLLVTEDSIQVVDLRIDNLDDGDHPFHLHGHRPWIMGTGPGRYTGQALNNTNPLRRDTVVIPAYNWLVLRFITDNPGLWAFHCHLAWHMAAGLLMQVNSLPSIAAQLPIPQAIVDQCSAS